MGTSSRASDGLRGNGRILFRQLLNEGFLTGQLISRADPIACAVQVVQVLEEFLTDQSETIEDPWSGIIRTNTIVEGDQGQQGAYLRIPVEILQYCTVLTSYRFGHSGLVKLLAAVKLASTENDNQLISESAFRMFFPVESAEFAEQVEAIEQKMTSENGCKELSHNELSAYARKHGAMNILDELNRRLDDYSPSDLSAYDRTCLTALANKHQDSLDLLRRFIATESGLSKWFYCQHAAIDPDFERTRLDPAFWRILSPFASAHRPERLHKR